jgi:hypothetical protein
MHLHKFTPVPFEHHTCHLETDSREGAFRGANTPQSCYTASHSVYIHQKPNWKHADALAATNCDTHTIHRYFTTRKMHTNDGKYVVSVVRYELSDLT